MSTVPGARKCGNVPSPIQVQYINSGAIRFRHQFSAVGYPFSCVLGEINCKAKIKINVGVEWMWGSMKACLVVLMMVAYFAAADPIPEPEPEPGQ
ncbi:hypothetical protein TNIN_324181 [Trichonephila inaurata madagascariensis]|uniref:Uncharacterized protein n=1 Tax=Trichonephila inaurata madagascariensis TaxID=2747483 RepID=A0A8X6X7R6_9ARAC|nr:hypothetical protein TNIN_347031 [Trichonephila inaurata madagascariensis]GFY74116.1 hypothetical protein TNIN_324181 [Trichonephila inaurata madagascariensis]